jgi:hypothetical protein
VFKNPTPDPLMRIDPTEPKRKDTMKKLTLAALLALSLWALPSPAGAHGFCFLSRFGGRIWGGGCAGGGCGGGYSRLSPWYLYYPYEAYFQTSAPLGYPYWPMMTAPAGWGGGGQFGASWTAGSGGLYPFGGFQPGGSYQMAPTSFHH